ncbi:MAG: DUF1569 domain-containing protein [Mucilaginibacter polytrichastri]|nr:DUF1569 domain-containing protein [Mucilaginibacter polytrichastri]
MQIPKLAAAAHRDYLFSLLGTLHADTRPLWGNMRAQQMIEHMIDQVQYTNGTQIPTCDFPPEEAAQKKAQMLAEDTGIPKNVKLGELPEKHLLPDLDTAIAQLMRELDAFDAFLAPPGSTVIHGAYGPMDHAEWVIWHSRHLRHHLKQFGALPPEAM